MAIVYESEYKEIIDNGFDEVLELLPELIAFDDAAVLMVNGENHGIKSKKISIVWSSVEHEIDNRYHDRGEDYVEIMHHCNFMIYGELSKMVEDFYQRGITEVAKKSLDVSNLKSRFELMDWSEFYSKNL
ncbi:hypothetical protein HZU75_06340 [Chitinibacter fontanus]|uniref:Uncharacterized protein n=1 Tax=Chitinibacter fontanus TaxID=1737446 RepID=A0A7D5V962_9NEIS|nr:hypothetical protein [Chitinibacter fontanus]QLI81179.1 hypothetical protein HZU75_06340 [Chitinibacter fontanus]